MPVGGRSALGANPQIRPIALPLGYLPESVGKCRRVNQETRPDLIRSMTDRSWKNLDCPLDKLLPTAINYHSLMMNEENRIAMATWLTLEEAAKHLKLGKSTLYQLARDGGIPAHKYGRAWRFDVEELDMWLKSGGRPGTPKQGNTILQKKNQS